MVGVFLPRMAALPGRANANRVDCKITAARGLALRAWMLE
jgi:hypothetical protein